MRVCVCVTCLSALSGRMTGMSLSTCYCGNTGVERILEIRVSTESLTFSGEENSFPAVLSRDPRTRDLSPHESGALTTELSPHPLRFQLIPVTKPLFSDSQQGQATLNLYLVALMTH